MRSRKMILPEHSLVAAICMSNFSYFIANHSSTGVPERVDDEAIIEIQARILKTEPIQSDHVGELIECSLVCSRVYTRDTTKRSVGVPLLYTIRLQRNGRSMLAYLPEDAFWAIQARVKSGTLKQIEAHYQKPIRGWGELTSLYFSERLHSEEAT
jgi:hypothetical protein